MENITISDSNYLYENGLISKEEFTAFIAKKVEALKKEVNEEKIETDIKMR